MHFCEACSQASLHHFPPDTRKAHKSKVKNKTASLTCPIRKAFWMWSWWVALYIPEWCLHYASLYRVRWPLANPVKMELGFTTWRMSQLSLTSFKLMATPRYGDLYPTLCWLSSFRQIDTARAYCGGTSEEYLGKLDWQKRGLKMETKLYPTVVRLLHLADLYHLPLIT